MAAIARELGLAQTLSISRLAVKLQEIKDSEQKTDSKSLSGSDAPSTGGKTDEINCLAAS